MLSCSLTLRGEVSEATQIEVMQRTMQSFEFLHTIIAEQVVHDAWMRNEDASLRQRGVLREPERMQLRQTFGHVSERRVTHPLVR
jgi:hypothetical protein